MIQTTSLREQLYTYLREEIQQGKIEPGASINIDKMCRELGISKRPSRKPSSSWRAKGS